MHREPAWIKVIDQTRCIGCHACSTACKSENQVPLSVNRTYVKSVDVGVFPHGRRAFQVTRCNQCADPPCAAACPTAAMFQRPDGIVDFDKSICIGCKACIAACPYDAIFINPDDHSAEKCNFCAHRVDIGLQPACVVVCPTQAIIVNKNKWGRGSFNEDTFTPNESVSSLNDPRPHLRLQVRKPEKGTRPQLFYKGARPETLDPLAAKRPGGGLFMWSQQFLGDHAVVSGHPHPQNSAAAVLSYDVGHRAPWDWRVSLYTWTKSIAAGTYLVALLLGLLEPPGVLWHTVAPVVSLLFLGLTGLILISDLEHPWRFYMIFTRPQWRSWLVRGAFVIGGYGVALVAHLAMTLAEATSWQLPLAVAGVPLAIVTAIYTAYLFAQSRGRELWQSALLAPHLFVQAVLAGAATLAPLAASLEPRAVPALLAIVAASAAAHLLIVAAETLHTRGTVHVRLALHEMVSGTYRPFFLTSLAAVAAGLLVPWLGVLLVPLPLLGLIAYEHAYVQAGQAVPLA
jgi:Fe-S-cluster-containing dehydrogenase component